MRTSVGLLGVLAELTLQVRNTYCVERRRRTMGWEEFEERWCELLEANRHFTFFWNPGAVADIRSLLAGHHPDQRWSVECRFTAGDPGWLSPAYERPSCMISCSGDYREEYRPYIADCAQVLDNYAARPHWGKLHFPDTDLWERLYPRLGEFRRLRDRLDPGRVLVNEWLAPLAG